MENYLEMRRLELVDECEAFGLKVQQLEVELKAARGRIGALAGKLNIAVGLQDHAEAELRKLQPDITRGDVIAAYEDGTCVLDDGVNIYNPIRAFRFAKAADDLRLRAVVDNARELTSHLARHYDHGEEGICSYCTALLATLDSLAALEQAQGDKG